MNVTRCDFQSASAPLNVRSFRNGLVSSSAVGAGPWRTPAAPAAVSAARAQVSCRLSTQASGSNRLTGRGNNIFHLRDALTVCSVTELLTVRRTQPRMAHTKHRALTSFPHTTVSSTTDNYDSSPLLSTNSGRDMRNPWLCFHVMKTV